MGKVASRSNDWGVSVESIQLKNIDLTEATMVRAMAKEAEATRERKAAMIRADGEYRSATELGNDDIAVELRRLQTLERIAKEKNQTTLLVPMQIFNSAESVEPSDMNVDLVALEAELLKQDKLEYDAGGDSLGDMGRDAEDDEANVDSKL